MLSWKSVVVVKCLVETKREKEKERKIRVIFLENYYKQETNYIAEKMGG